MMRILVITIAVVFMASLSSLAAGPRIIMIHGDPLTRPVILDNFQENLDLLHATANDAGISSKELANRPFLEMELFAGPYWVRFAEANNLQDTLDPNSSDSRARYYPAVDGNEAIMAYEAGLPRRVDASGLVILQRHGIPLTLKAQTSSVVTLSILVFNCLLILFASWRIKKRCTAS
jgi:hypothetical protein